jgi:flagellin
MGMRIQTNMSALQAQRNLRNTQSAEDQTLSHVASGSRITRAGEDAAGYSVSSSLNAHIRSTQAALRNTQDGISLVQVAEGAMQSMGDILSRLRELGIQAASDTIGDTERRMIDREAQNAKAEIDRIVNTVEYNGLKILNGQGNAAQFDVQVGIHSGEGHLLGVDYRKLNFTTEHTGLSRVDFSTKESSRANLSTIDNAIETMSSYRATLGAVQSRFSTIAEGLGTSQLNLSSANSRIKDADVASETTDLARNRLMREAGTAVLAQANTQPEQALRLLS